MPEIPKPKAIVLDIEGTICDPNFVHEKLTPFLIKKIDQYFIENYDRLETKNWIQRLRNSIDLPSTIIIPFEDSGKTNVIQAVVAAVQYLMLINYRGFMIRELHILMWIWFYRTNMLIGHVYDEVTSKLQCWKFQNGIKICLFSSSPIVAQKLMIVHTNCGNLLTLIDHFMTGKYGFKYEKQTYVRISECLNLNPDTILFISDNTTEVNAAINAGLFAALIFRENNSIPENGICHPKAVKIKTFDDIIFR